MDVLIKNATIVCSNSPFHLTKQDILINNRLISKIGNGITNDNNYKEIIFDNLHVSLGFFEIFSHFNEPGTEFQETIQSGSDAAATGGFSQVMLIPNTSPTLDNAAQIKALKERNANALVELIPIGAITKNAEGNTLAEMYDMHSQGVNVFSDGLNSLQNPALLTKALEYILPIDATIIQIPLDKNLNKKGLMNEGALSTQLGLKGAPAIAEELALHRDIELAKYTNSKIHFTSISTKKSVDTIAKAKQEGVDISCSVDIMHLQFDENELKNYDTNFKTVVPLRLSSDKQALIEGLKSGIIDAISVQHLPIHQDHKDCEFEYAHSGAIGLQTAFQVANNILGLEKTIEVFTKNNREIFGYSVPKIEENQTANICLFNPDAEFIFTKENNKSKSTNSPFFNQKMKGKILGLINNNQFHLND